MCFCSIYKISLHVLVVKSIACLVVIDSIENGRLDLERIGVDYYIVSI